MAYIRLKGILFADHCCLLLSCDGRPGCEREADHFRSRKSPDWHYSGADCYRHQWRKSVSRWWNQGEKDILEGGVLENVSLSMKGGVLLAREIKSRFPAGCGAGGCHSERVYVLQSSLL